MKKCLVILVIILAASCRGKLTDSDVLEELDKVLNDNPEMVLDSLNTFDPWSLNRSTRAYYYLLKAAAIDKCNKPLPDDSTLYFSQEYYKEKENLYFLARTQYYIGKTISIKVPVEAFEIFKEAERNLKESEKEDYHLLGLIYYRLGTIQTYNLDPDYLKEKFEQSAAAFFMAGDTVNAIFSLRSKVHNLVQLKRYEDAKESLDYIEELIEKIDKGIQKEKFIFQRASLYNAYSLFYTKQSNYHNALKYSKLCVKILEDNNLNVLPQYYYSIISNLMKLEQYEEIDFYKNKINELLEEEKDARQQIAIYKILIQLARLEENYKEASNLQEKYIELKDDFNQKYNFFNIEELERKYEKAEQDKRALKTKNRYLTALLICCLIITVALAITVYANFLFRKQKKENKILTKELERTRWGYALFKEIIEGNYQCFEVVDKFMMKNIQAIDDKLYNKFQEVMRTHKADYIDHIYKAFYNVDSRFMDTVQKIHKSINKDDLIIAALMKHGGESKDITRVLRINMEAFKKRKQRLKMKVMGDNNKETKLEMFFKEL